MALVSCRNVEKVYTPHRDAAYVAVRAFDLDIESGEFFCLLGPSGCGKTTVLNMLAGFESPTSGAITLNGTPVRGPARDRGVVFQGDDSLFTWLTAQENIEFGLRMAGVPARERAERALHFLGVVGLAAHARRYPAQMSGGMKQRVQIARVLANEPSMLLMDEPFAALDAQTRHLMQEQMRGIADRAGAAVCFITHDIDEAVMLGARIGVMTAGPSATLKGIVPVALDGPRERTDDAFMQVFRQVSEMIRDEVMRSTRRHRDEENVG